ncbi:MAG: YbhN family protein [Proteobacteria bacterium]|nr:YbhN family protein [Pseudomonadota bacterium]MBU6425858.1 YbhN family protein [Rhodospirillales bacterium]
MRRLLKFLPPVFGLLLLVAIVFGLHRVLEKVGLAAIFAAFLATPFWDVVRAVGLLAASICIMAAYDLPGVFFARRCGGSPHLPYPSIGLASFCAYALSHVLGATALTAAAIRLRFYAHWDVPPGGIARIVALSGSSFTLGVLSLLGTLLLADPSSVPLPGALESGLLRALGLALLAVPVFYVLAARKRDAVVVLGKRIALPGARIALAQIVTSCLDICCACAILHAVLPAAPGPTYTTTLSLYLGAFAAGVLSGLPGGVGVFDSVLLLGFSDYLPAAQALGAILLFRVMYFLTPACLAGLCYAGHELWIYAARNRKP